MSSSWIEVGAEADFAGQMKVFQIGRKKVAVAGLDGGIFAFDGLCPHAFGPMHRAEVDGAVVTCPYHAWRFDLRDAGREIHGYRPLAMYDVKVEAGIVHVLFEAAASAVVLDSRPCKLSYVAA
jgi:nitrite reductase (NADH) small subunit